MKQQVTENEEETTVFGEKKHPCVGSVSNYLTYLLPNAINMFKTNYTTTF